MIEEFSAWFNTLQPPVAAAVVAAIISLITTALAIAVAPPIKYAFDRHLESRKISLAYRFEQQKALKTHIAMHQGRFLEAADALNNRLWNYEGNSDKGWLRMRGVYYGRLNYYSWTFGYRFLVCLGAARTIQRESIYIDTTVALPSDFNFLKALRLNITVWTDVRLFSELAYDDAQATDHFFKDSLSSMSDSMISKKGAISQQEFETAIMAEIHPYIDVFRFFDNLGEVEERYRHDRVICAHLVLIATLNSFGYDFQQTDEDDICSVIESIRHPQVLTNLVAMIKQLKLEKDRSFKRLIKCVQRSTVMS